MTEEPTVGDRYAFAVSSSDLTLRAGRCDADRLLAAGYAARHDRRGLMALMVYRMRATAGRGDFVQASDTAAGWLIGRGVRAGGKSKINRTDADLLARSVLRWWLDDVCMACEGRRYEKVPGTPHLSANPCRVCKGTGLQPLEALMDARHLEQARWLASEFDALCGYVMADMARLLSQRMEL